MQAHRDKLQQTRRNEHLLKLLQKQRQAISISHKQQDLIKFKQLYPQLCHETYPQHKYFLSLLIHDQHYSSQLLMLAPIIHDYLLQFPDDVDSLHILKYISQYQQIQMPQTQEFVAWVNGKFVTNSQNIKIVLDLLCIVSNLLSYPKYHSMFRDRIIQVGFIKNIAVFAYRNIQDNGKQDQVQQIISYVSDIMCSVLASHPRLPLNILTPILTNLHNIAKHSQSATQSLLYYFSQLRRTHIPNSKLSKHLLTQLRQFIIKNYHGNQIYIIDLLLYCGFGNVYVNGKDKKIINIIIEIVKKSTKNGVNVHRNGNVNNGSGNGGVVEAALQCLGLYMEKCLEDDGDCDQLFQDYQEQSSIAQVLWNMLLSCKQNMTKIDLLLNIINVLCLINENILYDTFNELNNKIEDALLALIECLQIQQLRTKTTELISKLIEIDNEDNQNNWNKSALKMNFEALGGLRMLQKITNQQVYTNNQKNSQQPIQQLMDMFQSSMH